MSENPTILDIATDPALDYSALQNNKSLTAEDIKTIANIRIRLGYIAQSEKLEKEKSNQETSNILAKLESIPEKSEKVTPDVQAKPGRDKSNSVTPPPRNI